MWQAERKWQSPRPRAKEEALRLPGLCGTMVPGEHSLCS